MFRVNNFDKLLDKATSNLRLDPDWPTILQICDLIRQNDCTPKYAISGIKKKLYSQNPHQAMFALLVLESVVKNCGAGVHDEVGSKTFCETLRDLVKTTQHENLRTKILELIQAWAFAFRNSNKYRAVQDTVNILKTEGYKFPTLKESDAMFSADTAPEWADGEVCHRCRVAFSLMVRRHHCRACGQVFCQQCSSKTSTLPKFGIEKEVRVCDACYDKVSRPPPANSKLDIIDTSNDYGPTQPQKNPGGKSAEELQEEEELQLALALSQSEAEQKEKERGRRSHIAPDPTPHHPTLSPSPSSAHASPEPGAELSRYLDRGYWEQKLRDTAPTAPAVSVPSESSEPEYAKPVSSKAQDDDNEDKEIDEFVETLKNQIEIFVNRMKSNSSRGRSIANDTSVQTLFMNITAMHSRLLRYIQQQDDKRVYLESLQDKVNQVRDSRAALDTLRAEHAARLAAQAEAAERQRQMQMAAKLQAMRKKKHEYLQYQRQLALQRVQEQEREMQMRQEQQKHQYMMSTSNYYIPGMPMHQYQPGFPNQAMYANPQFHPQMMPQVTMDGSIAIPGQPQMSQANVMGIPSNQIGTISQSMPQLTNTYAMSTSGMTVTQAPMPVQSSMNQSNLRSALSQQLPLQHQQMLMQQMQMRMPNQTGMPQMLPQNMPGIPGQNGQPNQQLSKHNLPNQPSQANAMMPPMTSGQQNIAQPIMNPSNPMLGMSMQNVRLPMMQGNQPNPTQQMPGYPMAMQHQNNPQQGYPNNQVPNMQQPSQIGLPGQPMSLPGQQIMPNQQMPSQAQVLPTSNHISGQNLPPQGLQAPQPQPSQQMVPQMSMQGQNMPGSQMMVQGQQPMNQNPQQQPMNQNPQQQPMNQNPQQQQPMNQNPQQQPMNQNPQHQPMNQNPQQSQMMINQMPPNQLPAVQPSQQMAVNPQMGNALQTASVTQQSQPVPSQIMQGAHLQQQIPPGQMPQGQQMTTQPITVNAGQQISQQVPDNRTPQNVPGQPVKIQSQNFSNGPQGQHSNQAQQAPAPVKSENNNNTAELISFD